MNAAISYRYVKNVFLVIAIFFGASGANAGNWDVLRDFNSGTAGSVTQGKSDGFDSDAGASYYSTAQSYEGGQSVQLNITQGTTAFGSWGGIINFPAPVAKGGDIWLQLYIYIPSDFIISTPTNGSLKFVRIATATSTGSNGGYNDIQMIDDANQKNAFRMLKEGQAIWFPFGAPNSLVRDKWHRISIHLHMDTVPKSSGGTAQVQFWMDGALLTDGVGMQTLSNATDVAKAFYLFTYWNGSAPQTQHLWVDKIQISNYQPSWAADLLGVSSPPNPPTLQVR